MSTAIRVTMDPISKRVSVSAPYQADFVRDAKKLGGKWDGLTKQWVFIGVTEKVVRDLCVACYGVADGTPKLTREQLEANMARHIVCIVEIQAALDALDTLDAEGA